MGLKDMFRRKSGKAADKGSKRPGDASARGADDSTLFLDEDDAGSKRDQDQATGDSPVAPTEMMQVPPIDGGSGGARDPDSTTERLVSPDADATVAVQIPNFDSPGADAGADATVVHSTRGVGTETEAMPMRPSEGGDSDATVAVSIPDFDEEQGAGEQADVDTLELRTPDSDTARKPAVREGRGFSATIAIPWPRSDGDDAPPSAPPEAASDATVAVPIPDFDEPATAESAPTGPASDATVAVPIASLDEPAAGEAAQQQGSPEETIAFEPAAPPDDATVAVAVPDFDDESASTAKLTTPEPTIAVEPAAPPDDATVAVAVPDFDDEPASTAKLTTPEEPAGAIESEPAPAPAEQEAAAVAEAVDEPLVDSNAATGSDLPDEGRRDAIVTGVFVAIDGELAGAVYPIPDGETKLGRSETCDVVLPSMKISRQHATIVHQDGVFAILPLSEKNPTYVNDDVISGCELTDGDSIRMGRTTFRFRTIQGL